MGQQSQNRHPRVLLIDDDRELLELLGDYLERDGFEVSRTDNGGVGVERALSAQHDIVVLDVTMPGTNGLQLLGLIRARSLLPVIMLTARGDDMDRIVGLELGADDYVPKPCSPRELAARLRAILKRVTTPQASTTSALHIGELLLRPAQRFAELRGQPLHLTNTEFNLLECLARHAGQPVSKATLSEEAMGKPLTSFDRSIDVHISSMRQKIGQLADGRSRIQTVFRRGYLLVIE